MTSRGAIIKNRSKSARAEVRGSPNQQDVGWLRVVGARQNNLKNITVEIPLGRFVAVTGVSGSGKSSLVNDIIREALARDLNGATNVEPGAHDRIDGLEHLDKVIDIDQSPIGRTPRSNPATYIKVFDQIRELYARMPDAKVRGYKPGRFSFNVSTGEAGGGRCEACEGNGSNKMDMELLADVWVTCPLCEGRRFARETLQIFYKGKSISDVLEMDVQQALDHFENVPAVANMLRTLHDVGLDYLKLGQSSTTLSGGEAQRIKLARELVKKSTGRTLYILDEPTTGLHFADIKRLLAVLHGFVDAGNTVLVIEHNLDVIKTADWVIDLGPEGGEGGGGIVAEGTPEEVARSEASYTGIALREVLGQVQSSKFKVQKRQRGNKATRQERPTSRHHHITTSPHRHISVFGAKQHNLKDIDVEFPRNKITVCCGPSGSGKTSLAVDTVYTEGQRRYVESLSSYARQFLGQVQPPKVDRIEGLSPAVCIEQKNTTRSPRSTVGTITEIYDYVRVLWARIGRPHCPKCRIPITSQTADEIAERILALGEGERILLLAPVEPVTDESFQHLFERERANGYNRVRIDGELTSLDEPIKLGPTKAHRVEIVVDRISIRRAGRGRIVDSVEQALAMGKGNVMVALSESQKQETSPSEISNFKSQISNGGANGTEPAIGSAKPRRGQSTIENRQSTTPTDLRFSLHKSCEKCGYKLEDLTPHHFSFNTRLGWCEMCEGLGVQQGANQAAIIVHPTRSIADGAIAGWDDLAANPMLQRFITLLADRLGFALHTPWNQLTESQRLAMLHGTGEEWFELPIEKPQPTTSHSSRHIATSPHHQITTSIRFQWRGFFPAIARAARASAAYRQKLSGFAGDAPCEACAGSRLRPEPAAVRLGNLTLHEVCLQPLARALEWFEGLKLDGRQRKIAGELLHEITSRLRFLVDVGLDYLMLHRTAATLSGGEAQRIQLASQIGTGLTGVLYVLDEPTVGLHPCDNHRLIAALHRLRDLGNTLLLVEHDREVIDSADHVLDFGPGAGSFGGSVTAAATPAKLRTKRESLTGKYLSGKEAIAVPINRRPVEEPTFESATSPHRHITISPNRYLVVHGARENNLKEIDVAFPLGRFTCVTGVSGSGKSTLVNDILHNAIAARIHRAEVSVGAHDRIAGVEFIDKVINVDQSPIGNSPSSNPATYTGLFDAVRELFARLPLSKMRGYTPNRFSFNRAGGRCEVCEGMGHRCIEMHFLPDVWIECEGCRGRRYVAETLEAKYRDKSIADVLNMRVSDALSLFESIPRIQRMLQTLADVGLDYLELGRSAPTLSGGEAQRVKLAAELGRPSTGNTLYILDEPTTGLHFDDLRKLLGVLHRLVDLGNTVICIEHNLDVIKTADWIIDLGPEAGDAGGDIVAVGTPEAIAAAPGSLTGVALKPILKMGPHAVRVSKPSPDAPLPKAKLTADLGADVKMPWDMDGKAWHTVNHLDSSGIHVEWDSTMLVWQVDMIESQGGFLPTNWNHRTRVEITSAKDAPWFCHFLTGFKELLDVAVRVPRDTFDESALRRDLAVKTLDERHDLPIYGQYDRVRIRHLRGMAGEWDDIRLSLRDFKDLNKTAFRAFLKTAATAYKKHVARTVEAPELKEPWKVQGREWHLSQKSMSHAQVARWKPDLLLTLMGQFKKVQPDIEFDWCTKTAVLFKFAANPTHVGKIVTNMGRGLRIELRAPQNKFTPAMIEGLGDEPSVKRHGSDDWLIFWIPSLSKLNVTRLREMWMICRHGPPSQQMLA